MPFPESRYCGWEQEELAFLAEASAGLASSLDEAVLLERAAALPVPFLADRCRIEPADAAALLPTASLENSRIVAPLQDVEEALGSLILIREAGPPYQP